MSEIPKVRTEELKCQMGIHGTQLYGPTAESWSDSFKSCLWVLFWYLWCSRHSAGTVSPSPLPIWGWRCLWGSGGGSAGLSSRSHTAGPSGCGGRRKVNGRESQFERANWEGKSSQAKERWEESYSFHRKTYINSSISTKAPALYLMKVWQLCFWGLCE